MNKFIKEITKDIAKRGANSILTALLFLLVASGSVAAQQSETFANSGSRVARRASQVNGIKLSYLTGGKEGGETVVLLHGFPETSYAWRKVMPLLAANYRVIAPDLRGYGDSDKPPDGYDTRNLAEDVHRLVNQLGYKQIYLVGHDVGGTVAFGYAAAYPAEIKRLAVLDIAVPGFGFDDLNAAAWHLNFHKVPDLPETLIRGREREYLSFFYRNFVADPAVFGKDDVDFYVRAFRKPNALRGMLGWYRALAESSRQNIESIGGRKLSMPVLAVEGTTQSSVGALTHTSLARAAENVETVRVENCGHYIAAEKPEILAETLSRFFGEK